jgi:hypothetical protein
MWRRLERAGWAAVKVKRLAFLELVTLVWNQPALWKRRTVSLGGAEVLLWRGRLLMVGYLKMFVGLGRDRLEGLLSAPAATAAAHARTLMLLLLVCCCDVTWCAAHGPSRPQWETLCPIFQIEQCI